MSEEIQEMQRQLVAAVQQELTRFSGEVAETLKALSEEVVAGASARAELELQIKDLAGALESSQTGRLEYQTELEHVLEARLNEFNLSTKKRHDEMNDRLGRVADEANVGITAAVESAARPIIKQVEYRQDSLESEVRDLDGSLRKFDEQAGQMVEYINEVSSVVDTRLDRVHSEVLGEFDERMASMVMRVDEMSASVARQQSDISNLIGDRVDTSEARVNERMLDLETRMNEEIGQRVADIDAHVGRIGVGLDDAVITLNDRIAKADAKFTQVETTVADLRKQMESVDEEAIDEIKEKISSALGQAELVRIEMERFQETINESLDKTAVRLTEIETTVQDQSMDVETAVQLERLEEVERAVLMLDPDVIRARRGEGRDDATVAMTRPAGSDEGAASVEAGAPIVPPASSPLSPPTAGPVLSSEPVTQRVPSVDLSASLEPPVNR